MGRLRKFVAALMGCAVALSGGVLAADATLIEAAKKEGAVTWYTTLIVNQFAAPAAAAFEKKYGIHVDYVRANSAEIMIRLQNEARAGRVMGDVFDSFGAAKLVAEGLLESFIPEPARKFPKEFYDTKGFWVASNLFVLTPGYNTSLVPAQSVPRSYIDLLDPLWRGKMAWNSNSSPVSAPGFVGVVLAEMGEENGLAYLKKLAAQRLVGIPATPRQV
ncbi:MAG: putative binding protein component of iron transporter precursor, partial [Ramlibacter sp.]|nr:putative binding protein component of iron transporter precursor [Ramlibacter sp.]